MPLTGTRRVLLLIESLFSYGYMNSVYSALGDEKSHQKSVRIGLNVRFYRLLCQEVSNLFYDFLFIYSSIISSKKMFKMFIYGAENKHSCKLKRGNMIE